MTKKKILFVCGSLRKGSLNRQVGEAAEKILKPKAEVSWLSYEDLPYMNQDLEFPEPPAAVKALRQTIAQADGLWLFSPEYNHNIPGVLKNMLDWASRAQTQGGSDAVIRGKVVAFSIAAGGSRGAYCADALQESLTIMGAIPLESVHLQRRLDRQEYTTSKLNLTAQDRKVLEDEAQALLAMISETF